MNLVQNGDFTSGTTDWNGLIGLVANPHAPNGIFGLGDDIFQTVTTTPGLTYDLTFSSAADLYYGPTLTLVWAMNGQTDATIVTPSYTYNPGINRFDQMVWQQYTYSYTAISTSTRLEFIDENTFDFGLAAVSMTQVLDEPNTISLLGISVLLLIGLSKIRKRKYFF